MKDSVFTFGAAFILIFSLLHVQPLFLSYEEQEVQTCSQSRCPKQNPQDDQKECSNQGCNPFVPCSMGSCCYLVESIYSYSAASIILAKKPTPVNDNRILNKISECWHPPEILS